MIERGVSEACVLLMSEAVGNAVVDTKKRIKNGHTDIHGIWKAVQQLRELGNHCISIFMDVASIKKYKIPRVSASSNFLQGQFAVSVKPLLDVMFALGEIYAALPQHVVLSLSAGLEQGILRASTNGGQYLGSEEQRCTVNACEDMIERMLQREFNSCAMTLWVCKVLSEVYSLLSVKSSHRFKVRIARQHEVTSFHPFERSSHCVTVVIF